MWGYPGAFLHPQVLLQPRATPTNEQSPPSGAVSQQDLQRAYWLGNAVGLRTAHRGPIAEAILEVYFDRAWTRQKSSLQRVNASSTGEKTQRQWCDVAAVPIFDGLPRIGYSDCNEVPAGKSPWEFYSDPQYWHGWEELEEDPERSDVRYACYRKEASLSSGQMRMVWMPHLEYHPLPPGDPLSSGLERQTSMPLPAT